MAITTDSYGSVATPRIYIDYGLYCQTIGYVDSYVASNFTEIGATNAGDIFSLNPSKTSTFEIGDNVDYNPYIRMKLKNYNAGNDLVGFQVRHFLKTLNYVAFLGHNVGFLGEGRDLEATVRGGYPDKDEDVVGHEKGRNQVVYNIYTIEHIQDSNYPDGFTISEHEALGFKIHTRGEDWNGSEPLFEIGACSIGRYFDFPYSPDLDVSVSVTYPGVKTIRTQGGSDLRSVDYYRNDKWGSFAPWTHIDLDYYNYHGISSLESKIKEDHSKVSNTGKRVFKINYSYLDKTNIFPMNFENNMAGYYSPHELLGDNLITNGGFDDTSSWGISSGQSIVEAGVGKFLGNGGYGQLNNGTILEIGKTYKLKLKCVSNSDTDDGRVNVNQVTVFPNIVPSGETGNFVTYFECTDTTAFVLYNPAYNDEISIDDVELYEVKKSAGQWFDSNEGVHKDNLIGNFLTFTLGGQLQFIFQPDNTKQDFAICKLDKPSLDIKQEANGVYSISMTFREV